MTRIKSQALWSTLIILNLTYEILAQTTPASSDSDVRLPPAITVNPQNYTLYTSGTQVTLECGALGTPTPTYSWTWNGNPLTIDGTNIQQQGQGNIRIISATSADQGYYICIAANKWGTAFSITAFIQPAILGTFTPQSPGAYKVYQGQHIMLPCSPPTSVPSAIYNWYTAPANAQSGTDLTPVPTSDRVVIDLQGNLLISNAVVSDTSVTGYNYVCYVLNPTLKSSNGGSSATLGVTSATPNNTAPVVVPTVTPSPTNAVIGQSVQIFCYFYGYPTPTITWPTTLPEGRYTLSNSNSLLTITNLQLSDAMAYTCTGTNSAGTTSTSITINVNVPPYFPSSSDMATNVNATNGQSVSFICKAQSSPSAQIVWLSNGKGLTTTSLPNKFSISSDLTNLTISNVCKVCPDGSSDLQVIQCNISNTYGYVFGQGYLNVLDQTTITQGPSDQILASNTIITFTCTATSDPSTPVTILWYHNAQNITYNNNIYTDSSGSLHINTNGAPNGGSAYQGTYTCEAWNGFSSANASAQLLPPAVVVQSAASYWYVFLILGLLLLLLLLFLCWWFTKHNEGDTYPVDEQEVKNGNDPVKELQDKDFQAFQRPENIQQTGAGNRNSWTSINFGHGDSGSVMEGYSNIDGGKFNEEGSFIGQYTSQQNPLKSARLAANEDDGFSNADVDQGYSSTDRRLDAPIVSEHLGAIPEYQDVAGNDSQPAYYGASVRNADGTRSPDYERNRWSGAQSNEGFQYGNDNVDYTSNNNPDARPLRSPPPPPPTRPPDNLMEGSFDGGSFGAPPAVPQRRHSRRSPAGFVEAAPYYPIDNPPEFSAALTVTGPAGNQVVFSSDRNLNQNGQEYLEEERNVQPMDNVMWNQGSIHSLHQSFNNIGEASNV